MDLRLVSEKIAFKPEDLSLEEGQVWLTYLNRYGFGVNDPIEFFDTFGHHCPNCMFCTDKLRIRYWEWKTEEGYIHSILDMSHSPGDADAGIILIDDQFRLNIDDFELSWIFDPVPNFDMELFSLIRRCLEYQKDLEDVDQVILEKELAVKFIEYLKSENGKHAHQMNTMAEEKYDQDFTRAYNEK